MAHDVPLPAFFNALFDDLPETETFCLATPVQAGFRQYAGTDRKLAHIARRPGEWYVCISSVTYQTPVRRRKQDCQAVYVLMLDDIGTKAKAPPLEPSCILETSAGNYQWLYFIEPWELKTPDDLAYFDACNKAAIEAGYGDPGSGGVSRVFRIPGSINTKPGRNKWATTVDHWAPARIWELPALMDALSLTPAPKAVQVNERILSPGLPADYEDPVYLWLLERGRIGEMQDEWFQVRCPWNHVHTTGDDLAGYSPLGHGAEPLLRGFNCFHGHCEYRTASDFLAWVAEQGGPSCEVTGVREVRADSLQEKLAELDTAQRAELLHSSLPTVRKGQLPDVVYTATGAAAAQQKPTRANVAHVVSEYGIALRFNMQQRTMECRFRDENLNELTYNTHADVHRAAIDGCHLVGMSGPDVKNNLNELGAQHRYHPMQDWIRSVEWDGQGRLAALGATVTVIDRYQAIWPIYLRRWLIQCVQAVCGWAAPKQISKVLVLSGPQLIGKTTWLSKLVPTEYFLEGMHLDFRGYGAKDSVMKATMHPIVELGELEVTFKKADAGALKAYLSQRYDVYRKPFGTDTMQWPRVTSYCGSVNRGDFLVDETGSVRYWPVEVLNCEPFHGLDMQQIWAEIYQQWSAGANWELHPDEENVRSEQSDTFRAVNEAEEVAEQWFADHSAEETEVVNVTTFCKKLSVTPSNQNLSLARHILTRHVGPRRRQLEGVSNAWLLPVKRKTGHLAGAISAEAFNK